MERITNMAGRSLPKGKMVKAKDFLDSSGGRQTMEEQIAFMKSLGK